MEIVQKIYLGEIKEDDLEGFAGKNKIKKEFEKNLKKDD